MQSRVDGNPIDAEARKSLTRQDRAEENPVAAQCRGKFTRPQSRWLIAQPEELKADESGITWSEICGSECIARLLLRKGFRCAEEVNAFLRPRLSSLSDPFLLPQMHTAVARILEALNRRERIVLFGDYDVDGVTSLALLAGVLRAYGSAPELFLPLRME